MNQDNQILNMLNQDRQGSQLSYDRRSLVKGLAHSTNPMACSS